MKRAQTPLSLRRATIRDLSHVTGGAPAFGLNDKKGAQTLPSDPENGKGKDK